MNILIDAKPRFEAVLREEGLADRSQFDVSGFFDELPLFSRYRQISFLENYGNVNDLLIELSLDYLRSIIDQRRSHAECFAAITVWHDGEAQFLVPYIFFCNGWLARRLSKLRLSPPNSVFAKSLQRTLRIAKLSSKFAVAQDTITSPDHVRAFIGYRKAPGDHVAALSALTRTLAGPAIVMSSSR